MWIKCKNLYTTGFSLNIVFFPRILESLPPLPRQHSAAIGCTKNYQPIGVTVHSHSVKSFEGLLQRCRRGRGCSELWKNTIFLEHPVLYHKRLKDSVSMQNLNGTSLFHWSRHQYIYELSKTLPREVLATTRGSLPLVAISNHPWY